jgi:hypothetical protein
MALGAIPVVAGDRAKRRVQAGCVVSFITAVLRQHRAHTRALSLSVMRLSVCEEIPIA